MAASKRDETGINTSALSKLLYLLLNSTAEHFLGRLTGKLAIPGKDGEAITSMTAAELGALITFLKNNNISVDGAKLKDGPLRDIVSNLPQFATEDEADGRSY